MIKRTITETIEKYNKDGEVVEKTIRTETEEDDTNYTPSYPLYPDYQYPWKWNPGDVTCGTINNNGESSGTSVSTGVSYSSK